MKTQKQRILETLEFERGLDVDIDEGWRKLIARQFGGDPGRGFCELIQNFLDSYPAGVAWPDRVAAIETGARTISITDHGEGMNRERLRLLATLGGTDKRGDLSKIGQFGIGFFSIFNPRLETSKVRVTTRCEGHAVELTYHVDDPERRPRLSSRVLDGQSTAFSTRVEVEFRSESSPVRCLQYAERFLKYYPCAVTINGVPFPSAWEKARQEDASFFQEDTCDGYILTQPSASSVVVLCKYEKIIDLSLARLITGGRDCSLDLRDYRKGDFPYLPRLGITVNCRDLSVTISRDSFYLDSAWQRMVQALKNASMKLLRAQLESAVADDTPVPGELWVANQFTLANLLKQHFGHLEALPREADDDERRVCRLLAEAKVYRLLGRTELYSLSDIKQQLSPDLPLWFSCKQGNLRWLGGAFKHDFIVLPPRCFLGGGAPHLYDGIFGTLFGHAVNLDTIQGDQEGLSLLLEKGIVTENALRPKTTVKSELVLCEKEKALLDEINALLASKRIRQTIAQTLHLPARSIRAAYFEVNGDTVRVTTGLFGEDGSVLDRIPGAEEPEDYVIGLCLSDPLVGHLVESPDPYRAYYSLAYLSHRLTACQKQLAPQTRFFHFVRESLCENMRGALMTTLVPPPDSGSPREPLDA